MLRYIHWLCGTSQLHYTVKFSLIDGLYNKCNRQAVWVSFPQKKKIKFSFTINISTIFLVQKGCLTPTV